MKFPLSHQVLRWERGNLDSLGRGAGPARPCPAVGYGITQGSCTTTFWMTLFL